MGAPASVGVVLGGGVIGSSVLLYALGLGAVLRRGRLRLAIALLFVKLVLLLGVVWVVFGWARGRVDAAAFALGVSCFPAAAVWEAMRAGRS
jgi:hypothetical protein